MSTDAAGARALRARRAALRLAFGVTACFALVEALEWDATFLAPLLAAQMLVKLKQPPSFAQGLAVVRLIGLSTVRAPDHDGLHQPPAGSVLALAFLISCRSTPTFVGPELATLLVQISAVSLPVIAVLSPDGAVGFAATLLSRGSSSLLTVGSLFGVSRSRDRRRRWRLLQREPQARPALAARGTPPEHPRSAAVLIWFILDATEVAVVVLIVIVTLLAADPQRGQRPRWG